jgi:hypothetical protein
MRCASGRDESPTSSLLALPRPWQQMRQCQSTPASTQSASFLTPTAILTRGQFTRPQGKNPPRERPCREKNHRFPPFAPISHPSAQNLSTFQPNYQLVYALLHLIGADKNYHARTYALESASRRHLATKTGRTGEMSRRTTHVGHTPLLAAR